jgi:predicted SAM-dependent methyltransferase
MLNWQKELHGMMIKEFVKKFYKKLGYDISKVDSDVDEKKELIEISEIRKVNYGCGTVLLNGWINVDVMPANIIKRANALTGNIYYQMDLTKKHPFPDNSLEFAFAEDFIEHLNQVDSVIFLTEIYRTLQKNGVLRLSFPGFFTVLAQHFSEISYDQCKKMKAEAYTKHSHKHFFCFEELEQLCQHIGFSDIKSVEYGKSNYPDLRALDTRANQIGVNILVEIVK